MRVDANGITGEGARALAEALAVNTAITTVDVGSRLRLIVIDCNMFPIEDWESMKAKAKAEAGK